MQIKKIALGHMRNDLHFQFFAEFCALVADCGIAALRITAFWPAFLLLFEKLDTALKKIVMSADTEKIHEADKVRDALYSGFVKMVAALCEHYDPAVRDAARKVQVVIHTYGKVASKPLNEETSAIYNLVQELKSDKYKGLIAFLNLTEWLARVETANNNVRSLMMERDRENADKPHIAVKDARGALDDAYEDIIDVINAHLLLGQLTGCDAFVGTMNEMIHRFSIKTRRHKHGAHGAGPEGAEGTGDGAPTEG